MPQTIGLAALNVSCQRGGRVLFEGLSFALAPGEALLVTGPNGAGKTSLLRQIAGLLPLDAGSFSLTGAAPDDALPELCHYVGHLGGIKTALSVSENAAFWTAFLGGKPKSLESVLDGFGLGPLAHLPAGLLSAGQKRRLALTRLLAASRPIWILDEPFVSLDDRSTVLIERAIALHLAAGGVAVVASHVPLKTRFAHGIELGGERVS